MDIIRWFEWVRIPLAVGGILSFIWLWVVGMGAGMSSLDKKYIYQRLRFRPIVVVAVACWLPLAAGSLSITHYLLGRFHRLVRHTASTTRLVQLDGCVTVMPAGFFDDLLRPVEPVNGRSRFIRDSTLTLVLRTDSSADTFLLAHDNQDSLRYWILDPRYESSREQGLGVIRTRYLRP